MKKFVKTAFAYLNCSSTLDFPADLAPITTFNCLSNGSEPSSKLAKSIMLVMRPFEASTTFFAVAAPRLDFLLNVASAAVVNNNRHVPSNGEFSPLVLSPKYIVGSSVGLHSANWLASPMTLSAAFPTSLEIE